MREELEHQLYQKYPEIFTERFRRQGLAIGDGWYDLVDTLCAQLVAKKRAVEYLIASRQRILGRISSDTSEFVAHQGAIKLLEEECRKASEQIPEAVQVKEKFGALRFYIYNGDETAETLCLFAEDLSKKICEQCGAPGRTGSSEGMHWLKTLCDQHHYERAEQYRSRNTRED